MLPGALTLLSLSMTLAVCGFFNTAHAADCTNSPGTVTVYPATIDSAVPFNPDFVVTVDGKSSPVYSAKITTYHVGGGWLQSDTVPSSLVGFTNFDITGSVTAVVTVNNRIVSNANVYPSSIGVTPTVSGNTVTVSIPKTGKYELQINGDEQRPLYLFANPVETNVPQKGAPGVTYYGPGKYNVGHVNVSPNTTVYLAPGAIVHGAFSLVGDNETVRGRGILDGSVFANHAGNMVDFNGHNDTLEGITVVDSPGWTINLQYSTNGLVDNAKVISYRGNSDAIDIVSSHHVEVKNVFLRGGDDAVAVKASLGRDADDYYIHDSVMATDLSTSCLEIGREADSSSISNIRFENIDCIHSYAEAAIDIGTGDWANIHDITYTNIRFENFHGLTNGGRWFAIQEAPNYWSSLNSTNGKGPGSMNNITFNNVTFISGDRFPSVISGYDADHMITGVTFNNLQVLGQKITNANQINMSISNATNIVFK